MENKPAHANCEYFINVDGMPYCAVKDLYYLTTKKNDDMTKTIEEAAKDYALFQEKTRVFLTAKGFQNVNNHRYIDEIQLCCFDLQRRDNAVWENKTPYEANKLGAMKPMQFDWYIRAVGIALITNKN